MATILGLDIDANAVRGVVLKTALRKSEIVRYVSVPIEPAAPVGAPSIDGEDPIREDPVRAALRRLHADIGTPTDRVITGLDGSEVSLRKVTLPSKAAKRLDDILPFELEGTVPFDADDSLIDHQPIRTKGGEMTLFAAVLPKERIASHLDEMKSLLGQEPREVAVGAVAFDGLVPLVPALATPGPHCLIDIHARGTDVCILQDGVCHFARTLSVTVAELDRGRQDLLERELKQTMAAWRVDGGVTPGSFWVCGTMAVRDGIAPWLSQILSAPVEVLSLPAAPGADDAARPAFARAAALAGRALGRGKHLDARVGEFAAKQTATALRQHLPLAAACLGVLVVAFIFSSYARYSVLEARHTALQGELARVTDEFFGTEATTSEEALRLLARGARGSDPMPQFDAYDALAAISETIPPEVVHDVRQLQIDLGDGDETARFSLRGSVESVSDTEAIVRALQNHRLVRTEGNREVRLACFHGLDLGNTTATADDRRSYRLEGEIRCQPEGQEESEGEGESRSSRRRGRRQ